MRYKSKNLISDWQKKKFNRHESKFLIHAERISGIEEMKNRKRQTFKLYKKGLIKIGQMWTDKLICIFRH